MLLHVPYAQFTQVVQSFGRDQKEVEKLLFECMPTLGTYAQASLSRVFSCFQEFHFTQGQTVFKEAKKPEYLHLIAEGEVKMVASANPYTKVSSNHSEEYERVATKHSSGQGTFSSTLTQNQIGYVQSRQWVGEESAILDLPVIYSAVASSPEVKVLRISSRDFLEAIPADVINKIEAKLWEKMRYLRDRLLTLHETKSEILKLDPQTESMPATVNHVTRMYPNSTRTLQKKVRAQTLEKSGNNPGLLLFTDNRRADKVRQYRAEANADAAGEHYQSFREKLNSASKRRTQLQYGTVQDGQSSIDLVHNDLIQSLAKKRTTQMSPVKTINSKVSMATLDREFLYDQVGTLQS